MSKKLIVVSATSGDPVCTSIYHSVEDTNEVLLDMKGFNSDPLPKVYNEMIDKHSDAEYIVFIHDDVSMEDRSLYGKIVNAIGPNSEYSVCGVAGNTKARIQDKNLWHLMGDKKSMSGAVAHYTGKDDTECFMTNFGKTPQRCILLDGVFLAINVKDIIKAGVRFDENNPAGFHFYDLDFCLQCNQKGVKMTTYPIWIVHRSHGLSDINHEEWNKGNEYFKKKWKK